MFLPTAPTKCQIDGSRDKMGMGVVPKKKKPYYFFPNYSNPHKKTLNVYILFHQKNFTTNYITELLDCLYFLWGFFHALRINLYKIFCLFKPSI